MLNLSLFRYDQIFWKGLIAAIIINILTILTGTTLSYSAIRIPELNVNLDEASWIGMGSSCYVYVAEVSRPDDRGFLSLIAPICACFGTFCIYLIGYIYTSIIATIFSICCGLTGLILSILIPESPIWLNKIGKHKEALQSAEWFGEFAIISISNSKTELPVLQPEENTNGFLNNFIRTKSWKPLLIMVLFSILQNASGVYIVIFYAVSFIERLGSSMQAHFLSMSLGLLRLVMCIVGSITVQMNDRRHMVMISSFGMGVSMFFAGLYEFYFETTPMEKRFYNSTPVILLIIYIIFTIFGINQLPWALNGEIFPLSVRGVMNGITPSFFYIVMFVTIKIYPMLQDILTMSEIMWLFAGVSFATVLFGKFILPETRGKSLEEIENYFMK